MGGVLTYFQELTDAMTMLAKDERTLFIGKSVRYGGQRAHQTFSGVPMEKRIEMPVCEDFTVGFAIGLSLEGYIPIVFIPRWDFLILAANQILNHLDKIPMLGGFDPKVIIRTAVGAKTPLDPGPQHTQDYTNQFFEMCKRVHVVHVSNPLGYYKDALDFGGSKIFVEFMERY